MMADGYSFLFIGDMGSLKSGGTFEICQLLIFGGWICFRKQTGSVDVQEIQITAYIFVYLLYLLVY